MSASSGFVGRLRGGRLAVLGTAARVWPGLRVQSVLEGYIANQAGLCREFGLAASTCAGQVLAHSFRAYGARLCERVWGEWSAALFDQASGELLLTHDALGTRTMFFVQDRDEIVFASQLENLLRVVSPGELDETYIAQSLVDVDDHGDATPWRRVRRLPQGQSLRWCAGRARVLSTYRPVTMPRPGRSDPVELAEHARALMTQAVAGTMPDGARVWCELSGGLDSSSVVSLAVGVLQRPIETFSVIYSRSTESDESAWIDRVLATYPVPSHRLDADQVPPFSTLPTHFHAEPGGEALIGAFNQARRALLKAHGVQVILTGMCGDAVFVGDSPQPVYLADLWHPLPLLREVGRWAQGSPVQRPFGYWLWRYALRPRLPQKRLGGAREQPPSWLGTRHQARWHELRAAQPQLTRLPHGETYYWERVLKGALLSRAGQHVLDDVCSSRNPWLHLPLVEFMASAPWPVKLRPDSDRALQREAMREVLPEAIRQRRDKRVPTQAIFGGLHDSPGWLELLTHEPRVVQRGDVLGPQWNEVVQQARLGFCPHPGPFMQACMLEAWLATLDQAPTAEPALLDVPAA